jgi:hypothetical protein
MREGSDILKFMTMGLEAFGGSPDVVFEQPPAT